MNAASAACGSMAHGNMEQEHTMRRPISVSIACSQEGCEHTLTLRLIPGTPATHDYPGDPHDMEVETPCPVHQYLTDEEYGALFDLSCEQAAINEAAAYDAHFDAEVDYRRENPSGD